MNRWKKVLPLVLGALALPAAATGYASLNHSKPADAAHSAPRRPLSCRLHAGEELGYSVESTSEGRKPEASAPERASLTGEMWWRVIEERGSSGWVVAATLHDVHQEGARAKDAATDAALATPFLVRVGHDCSFRELAFDPTTQTDARSKLEGLVRSIEVVLSPMPSAQWVSRQHDTIGASDVRYKLDPAHDEEGIALIRNRMRYDGTSLPMLPRELGGRLRIDVIASDTRVVVDAEGRWIHGLEGREKLRIRTGDRVVTELSTTTHLVRLDEGRAPESLTAIGMDRFAWGKSAAAPERASDEPPPVDPGLAALDVNGAINDFAAVLASGPQGQHDATSRLAGYLAAHPQAIDDILGRMRRGQLDEKLHAPLFLALEKAGTPAAERGLAGALADRGMSQQNRVRAAAALQDIPRPSERTAEALIEQARAGRKEPSEKPVANAAVLALGALSSRTEKKQPEVARLANDHIRTSLRDARGTEDVAVALDAIGNSGDTEFAKSIEPYTNDASAVVRARAATAYRSMDKETMEPVLADWLGQEKDPEVRRAIAGSLLDKTTEGGAPASTAVLAAAEARLPTESDVTARAALIALIGSAAASDPGAKSALVEQFKHEKVADLLVLIGRFVGAEDLR